MTAKGKNKGPRSFGFHVLLSGEPSKSVPYYAETSITIQVECRGFLRSGMWNYNTPSVKCETYRQMRIPPTEWTRLKKLFRSKGLTLVG